MAIPNRLLSALVIIVIIFPEIAALVISPTHSAPQPGRVRSLLGTDNVSQPDNTIRVDPLKNFKKYRGGFNITNKHYWSSVIFTGVYGYAIGVLCLLCGLLYAIFLATTKFCCKTDRRRKMNSRYACNYKSCDFWLILLAVLLTIFAFAATGVVLAGSARFHSEARASVNIIIRTANEASKTLYNTTGALKDIQTNLEGYNVGDVASNILSSTSDKLDAESAIIQMQASKNRRLIHKDLRVVFILTNVTICLNLVAAAALSVSGVFRLRRALHLLIVLCWLMTVICWMLFGVYYFLDKFSNDACTALDNFEENPYNNSLSSILPCEQLLSAKSVLSYVSAGIYNLVNQVNANISAVQGTTYPNTVRICNPFSAPPEYLYQPENCPANTVRIGDIPKVLKIYMCSDAEDGMCNDGKFVSGSVYDTVEAYTSSIQDLLNVYPSMENLVECQSVKQAFSEILVRHCKPLKKFARMAWAGMVFLAVVMLLSVLLWTMNPPHRHPCHFSHNSVNPHSATQALGLEIELGLGVAKEIDHH